jgi:hypothetical protein
MKKFEKVNKAQLSKVYGGNKINGKKVEKCVLSVGSAFASSIWAKSNPWLAGANLAYNTGKYCLGWGPQKVY